MTGAANTEASHRFWTAFWFFVAAAYTAFLFVSGSAVVTMREPLVSDKVMHAWAFFWLSLFYYFALRRVLARGALVLACGGAAAAGGALEVLQAFLPHRSAELLDFVADVVGSLVAAGLVLWARGRGEARVR